MWRTRGRINFSTRGHLLLKVSSKIWALRGFQRFSGTKVSPHERTAVIFLFLLPFPSHTYQQHIKCIAAMRVKILFCISSLSNGFECPGFLFAAYFHTSACRYPCTVVSPSCCYWRKPHNKVFISVYLHQQLYVDVDNFREGKVLWIISVMQMEGEFFRQLLAVSKLIANQENRYDPLYFNASI